MATNLSNLCRESARVLLSSSMMRLGACKLPYWSWSGCPWLWWRPDSAASWDGSKVPWWGGMPWGGAHFWERVLRGLGDGEGEVEESNPPGGTQIITFLGGKGGECFPPGIQGNFIGWQESAEEKHTPGQKKGEVNISSRLSQLYLETTFNICTGSKCCTQN